jgi:hypothetical protein
VENRPLTPATDGDVLEYNSHAERRAAEKQRYWSEGNETLGRPSTSNERQNGEGEYAESFGQIRTEQGVFIAAKETSQDWLTSYDCLGKLKAGWTARVPLHNDTTDDLPRRNLGKTPEEDGPSEDEDWRLFVPALDRNEYYEEKKERIEEKNKEKKRKSPEERDPPQTWTMRLMFQARKTGMRRL